MSEKTDIIEGEAEVLAESADEADAIEPVREPVAAERGGLDFRRVGVVVGLLLGWNRLMRGRL